MSKTASTTRLSRAGPTPSTPLGWAPRRRRTTAWRWRRAPRRRSGCGCAELRMRRPIFLNSQFSIRKDEADAYYAALQPPALDADARLIQRQAFAGMLWSKQFYHYDVDEWLRGDPAQPPPPAERLEGRNREWR